MEQVRQTRAHLARLELSAAQTAVLDGQAHTARALWNLLHEYATFRQGRLATAKECDEAIRAARREIDWMGQLPAQAAQAVLKAYRQAWANFFNPDHPAGRPRRKARLRSRMAVDVPQARDLQIKRLNRRWGAVTLLEYKTRDRGGRVVKVPAAGTSATCHRCGHRDAACRDGTRFLCANPVCGWTGHADTNAAINIRNAAGTAVSGRGDLGAARSAKRQPPRAG
ncbi:zinc ribbon domain-containing protein [Streptosporangium sp. NPDC000396]|uniref:zinc ribbon domain-containing protein n=1 Tax=Streptosporangium sp. NPDC000396 TaxID=3366185 RepID=UPI00367AFC6E